MWFKIGMTAVIALGGFFAYVSTRAAHFRYVRSGLIQASPAVIFPYISQLKLGGLWSPYEKKDPQMKKIFSGEDGKAGASMQFDGNRDAGSGVIEILKVIQNERVEMNLKMTKPINADNLIEYTLTPEGDATRFTWAMSGDGGFLNKLVGVVIDCEKMIATDFEKGILNLKTLIESKK